MNAKRSRFARAKGVRVRITYAYNDPLSEASVLHPFFPSPLHPPRARQIRMPSSFFYFFYSYFPRLQQTRSIFPPSSAWKRSSSRRVWRVFTSNRVRGDSRGNFRIFEGMTGRKGCKIRGDWCIRYLWNDVEKEKEIWSHSFLLSFFFFVKGRIIGWITCKENNSLNALVTIPMHIPYTYFLFFLRICINKYRYIHKKYSPLNHPI